MEFLIVFAIGLIMGLIPAFIGWVRIWGLKRECDKLKKDLGTAVYLQSQAVIAQQKQAEADKERIRILETNIEILKQEPSRQEMNELRIYARCYRKLAETVPGFDAIWHKTIEEAKLEEENKGNRVIGAVTEIRHMFAGMLSSLKSCKGSSNSLEDVSHKK